MRSVWSGAAAAARLPVGDCTALEAVFVHRNPMHLHVRLGKLGQARKEVTPWLLRNGHHHIGGTRPIDGLIEPVEPPENRHGVGSRVDGEMAATQPGLGELVVTGIHESDDCHSPGGSSLQVMQQLPRVAPRAHKDNAVSHRGSSRLRVVPFREVLGISHELPPIHRSAVETAPRLAKKTEWPRTI
jgi:hypothetical protein